MAVIIFTPLAGWQVAAGVCMKRSHMKSQPRSGSDVLSGENKRKFGGILFEISDQNHGYGSLSVLPSDKRLTP